MENALDVFKADGFSLIAMTDAINKAPFVPGRIGELGIFEEFGVDTLSIQLEEKQGQLYLIPSKPRGAPATVNPQDVRKLRTLTATHKPVSDFIRADEIQGIRAFGQTTVRETIQGKITEKMNTIANSYEATFEHMRVGALKGIVYDADGTSELYDLFSEFGVTALTPVSFDLDAGSPTEGDVRRKCNQVIREMQDSLGAARIQGVMGFCGKDFLDSLVDHSECRVAWKRWQDGEALRASFVRRSFPYAGIMFEEYRGSVGSEQFIADDECRFFPLGVPGLFRMAFAPADYIETVNTIGLPKYAKIVPDRSGKGVDLECQSNPLPYCTRPRVLRQGLAAS